MNGMTDLPRHVSLPDLRSAYPYLRGRVRHTPLIESDGISERAGSAAFGASLRLKMENQQRTGSFKVRGATWKVASLTPDERQRGVVSASAGNHGQGVALAARDAGVTATVFVPRTASIAKIAAMEGYGAKVRLEGIEFADADRAARLYSEETGATFIPAFDDDAVITGQGSLGLELLDDVPDVDTVIVPIGGGGLFAGMAIALKETNPRIRIIGVQAEGADSTARSFAPGKPVVPDRPDDETGASEYPLAPAPSRYSATTSGDA